MQHGTNRYGLKLGCFTTVDNSGVTIILAVSLLADETTESFEWAFHQLNRTFCIPPRVIFTDSDPAMGAAIASVMPHTIHFLCTFHLSQNLYQHIHPLFRGGKSEAWNVFCTAW
jgi:hypothetical protein